MSFLKFSTTSTIWIIKFKLFCVCFYYFPHTWNWYFPEHIILAKTTGNKSIQSNSPSHWQLLLLLKWEKIYQIKYFITALPILSFVRKRWNATGRKQGRNVTILTKTSKFTYFLPHTTQEWKKTMDFFPSSQISEVGLASSGRLGLISLSDCSDSNPPSNALQNG